MYEAVESHRNRLEGALETSLRLSQFDGRDCSDLVLYWSMRLNQSRNAGEALDFLYVKQTLQDHRLYGWVPSWVDEVA